MKQSDRILVLGAGGLAGSSIVRRLRADGYHNLSMPRSAELDLRNQQATEDYFQSQQFDYVFLAAALVGGIMANKTRKAEFLRDNLLIQTNTIDSACRNRVQKLLFLGTSCIYPTNRAHALKEDELLTGPLEPTNDAYAIAKIAGIKMCDFYREQYGFNAISIMPPNLYGPGDNFSEQSSHVLAALMKRFHHAKITEQETVECWGDGTPRREFLYVDDLADASLYFMNHYDQAGHVNVGSGYDVSIRDLAESVAEIVGYQGKIGWDTSKPNGNPVKLLDNSKAAELGWQSKTPFREGLRNTYAWYVEEQLAGR